MSAQTAPYTARHRTAHSKRLYTQHTALSIRACTRHGTADGKRHRTARHMAHSPAHGTVYITAHGTAHCTLHTHGTIYGAVLYT